MRTAFLLAAALSTTATTTEAFSLFRPQSSVVPTTTATALCAASDSHDANHSSNSAVYDSLLDSEAPKSLGPKRSFLGMRRESGVLRRMMAEQQGLVGGGVTKTTAARQSSTALSSSMSALMPDGGLSPCVIKVLGVGGGGSNAVRCCYCDWISL